MLYSLSLSIYIYIHTHIFEIDGLLTLRNWIYNYIYSLYTIVSHTRAPWSFRLKTYDRIHQRQYLWGNGGRVGRCRCVCQLQPQHSSYIRQSLPIAIHLALTDKTSGPVEVVPYIWRPHRHTSDDLKPYIWLGEGVPYIWKNHRHTSDALKPYIWLGGGSFKHLKTSSTLHHAESQTSGSTKLCRFDQTFRSPIV